MQPCLQAKKPLLVVFTFQKEGRCNGNLDLPQVLQLFLPFKKKADATNGQISSIVK